MLTVKIGGTGSYLPSRIVTNEELSARISSTSEWIYSHTGIERRHVAAENESAATMGIEAARRAMEAAQARPEEVGMIALATTTPDYGNYPSTACLVQKALGCVPAAAFDLSAACSGFVYGLEMVKSYLLCHPGRKALVIGTEVLSRQVDWSDRSNAMLFGDGAAAVVLETVDGPAYHLSASLLGADGNGSSFISREGGSHKPLSADFLRETVRKMDVPYLRMDGHAVYAFAVRKLAEVVNTLCDQVPIRASSLDLVFPHQANYRILEAVARRMSMPLEKFYMNLRHVGNTSSASIPLCLDKAVREGALKKGMRLAFVGFGSGLTWAGLLAEWPYL